MRRLVLFDIDGTLLAANGVGSMAMGRAMERVVGSRALMDQIAMAGKCDWAIWREALGMAGYTIDEADAQMEHLFRVYVSELADVLSDGSLPKPRVLPGVPALLQELTAREDVLVGLLTGNVEAAAWLKLGRVGLDGHFAFGAFGNDSAERSALPALAVERAALFARGRRFAGKDIVIIGDTIHDIYCGASLGVCAIGITTGPADASTLMSAGADYVFDSLSPEPKLLKAIAGI